MAAYQKPDPIPTAERTGVIYARYSSHSQRDVSIDQQIRACRQFAQLQGIGILNVYEDRATTGTNDRRPAFQQMMKDAEKGSWNYVIVYTLDRFSRNRYDSAVNKRTLKNYGIKVLSAMENISDDPTGVLMESVLEGLAEYYSQELSRKIRRGMDDNAEKCLVNGQIPFGYVRGEDGRFAIDEAEAAIVQEIYSRIRDGDRIVDLISDLNDRGILNKRRRPWSRSTFNSLLTNERYTGVYIYKDVRIPGGMPQIISQSLFDAVQLTLHTKKNPRSGAVLDETTKAKLPQRRRQENGIYYLTGKLYCGHCHSPMIGISGRSKCGPMYYYYTCKGKRADHTCDKKNVNRDYIEQVIASELKKTMLTDKAICALADAAVEFQKKHISNGEADMLQLRLDEVQTSIRNLLSAMEAGIFSASLQSRLTELETEKRTLTAQLTVALEEAESMLSREDIIAALALFQDGDLNDKNFQEALIDTFLVAAYIYDDHLKIIFNLSGKMKKSSLIPFNIEDVSFSDTSTENCRLHQTVLYEHFSCPVIMIGDLFVFSKAL